MKKLFYFIIILVIIPLAFSILGCSNSFNKEHESIIKIAYNSLPDSEKKTIKDWKNERLEDYRIDESL